MKALSIICILILFPDPLNGQDIEKIAAKNTCQIKDELSTGTSFQPGGYIGGKLEHSLQNRILAQDVKTLVAPFTDRTETRCWQSEFWGKWITSAILAYRYEPSAALKEKLDQAVDGLIASQSDDGYIGNYAADKRLEAWDIWGRKYCMLGLISYYSLTTDKKSLEAACKVADHLMEELKSKNTLIVKAGNHRGMAASSVLEPVCLLYRLTGDQKYLSFAEEIVRQWETPDGPQLISKSDMDVSKRFPKPADNWYGWEQGQKAYEMMSCYEGLLELYRITGKEEFRKTVERVWENIRNTEINIAGSGSSRECWFEGSRLQALPVLHYQETCVTTTWIKLSYQLLRLTGESKYADAIEQSYYNALLGAQLPDGSDWAKYSPLSGHRMRGTEQCHMGLNCCVASGPRALFALPPGVVMSATDGLQVNFFVPGTYSALTPGKQQMKMFQKTGYPADNEIVLKMELPDAEDMVLRIRIPAWSRETAVKVNGEAVDGVIAGECLFLKRKWENGDSVVIWFDMRGRVIVAGGQPQHFAIVRGPVVLSRDARLDKMHVETNIIPVADKECFIDLQPVDEKDPQVWMQFTGRFVPESYAEEGGRPVEVNLCDYASAGNTYGDDSWFRTWFPILIGE